MPIQANIPLQATAGMRNPLADIRSAVQTVGAVDQIRSQRGAREVLGDPESYTEGGGMSAADLRPEAMVQLRGYSLEAAMGVERFAAGQEIEQRRMEAYERTAKAKTAEQQAGYWQTLKESGMRIRAVYDDAMARGDKEFVARSYAQAAYEGEREALSGIAETLGFEMPPHFSAKVFAPETFAQFQKTQQALEQEMYMLRVPVPDADGVPGAGGTRDVAFYGTGGAAAAEAGRLRATDVATVGKGLPEVEVAEAAPGAETFDPMKGAPSGWRYTGADREKLEVIPGGPHDRSGEPKDLTPEESWDRASDLRDDFVKSSGDYVKVRDAMQRIEASAEDSSAAGDLALIFNYMKVLDPGSTVREGEFLTAQQSASFGQRVNAAWNKVVKGTRLDDDQRADFLDRGRRLYQRQLAAHRMDIEDYKRLARAGNVDEELVIRRLIPTAEAKQLLNDVLGAQGGQPAPAAPAAAAAQEVPTPTTQAEFDALPSGAQYYDPDDEPGSKPRIKP